jgi:hypothetical protein
MRGHFLTVLFGLIALIRPALPVLAHHSLGAEFDLHKQIKLTGVVTKVEWTNPHTWFYVDVQDPKTGKTVQWALQLGGTNTLARLGWTRSSLKVGDIVTVQCALSRENWHNASARQVWLSDGHKVFGTFSAYNESR